MLPPENDHLQHKFFRVWGFFTPTFHPFYWLPVNFPSERGERSQEKLSFHQRVSLNLQLKAASYSPCPLKPSVPVV